MDEEDEEGQTNDGAGEDSDAGVDWFERSSGRRYPVLEDENGITARERCFEMFEQGGRPAQVARALGLPFRTVTTYFAQWRREPPHRRLLVYETLQKMLHGPPDQHHDAVVFLCQGYGYIPSEVEEIISQPYGLKKLLERRRPSRRQSRGRLEDHARRQMVDNLVDYFKFLGIDHRDLGQVIGLAIGNAIAELKRRGKLHIKLDFSALPNFEGRPLPSYLAGKPSGEAAELPEEPETPAETPPEDDLTDFKGLDIVIDRD
jgi:hypothetical protein